MKKFKLCINIKYLLLVIALYGFVLENFVELNFAGWFGYIDEVMALVFGIIFLYYLRTGKCREYYIKVGLLVLVITLSAILSTVCNNYQPIYNCMLDLYANVKFPMILLGGLYFYSNFNLEKYARKLGNHVKFITIVFFALTIIDLFLDIFPDSQYQFYKHGMKSLRLIYGHPATLSVVCLLLLSILIFLKSYGVKSTIYEMALILMMVMAFRAKIIGTLFIIFVLSLVVIVFNKKITITKMLVLLPFLAIFAWNEIQSYYITNQQASRLVLTLTSLDIAKDKFPLGAGLATFGSAFSITPYSPIYSLYGISNIWGLSENTAHDISDTFWPMILGEFGIVALIAYIGFVYCIYKEIQTIKMTDNYKYIACWSLLIYILVASTSESAFVNAYSVFYGIFMTLFINSSKIKNRRFENECDYS